MSVLIYRIDNSKLNPIGENGYKPGQEQAKVYFDEVPKGDFTVAITDEDEIKVIASMAKLDLKGNNRILISVDNEDDQHVGMTIYYYDTEHKAAHHCMVSHANCKEESNYELANRILRTIEAAFYLHENRKAEREQNAVPEHTAENYEGKYEYTLLIRRYGRYMTFASLEELRHELKQYFTAKELNAGIVGDLTTFKHRNEDGFFQNNFRDYEICCYELEQEETVKKDRLEDHIQDAAARSAAQLAASKSQNRSKATERA